VSYLISLLIDLDEIQLTAQWPPQSLSKYQIEQFFN